MTRINRKAAATLLAAALFAFAPGLPAAAADSGGSNSAANTAQPGYAEAKAASDAGRYQSANKILAKVVKAEPANADAWNLLGYTSRKLKNYDAAAKYYQTALKLDPKHRGALEYQGELFIQTGAFDQAKANLKMLKSICGTCEEYTDLQQALTVAGQS